MVCFLWLLFKYHNDGLPNAKSAELWDGAVAGLFSQGTKIMKRDPTMGFPS